LASPLPLPGEDEDSDVPAEAATGLLEAGPELAEASIPRSLACSAAAVEEEFPGAGAGSGFGAEVVASGFGLDG
jgi:hypothetical protein